MRSFLIIIILLLLMLNCSASPEKKKTIDSDTFVQLYCDVVARYDILARDKRKAFVDSTFQHYDVSRDVFENTVERYSTDPESWEKIFDKIVTELEKRAEAISDSSNQTIK